MFKVIETDVNGNKHLLHEADTEQQALNIIERIHTTRAELQQPPLDLKVES